MNKRQRMDQGMSSRPGAINVQTANFTRCNVKKSRRISKRRRLDKLTQAGANYVTLRADGVNGYAQAGGGYYIIANCNNTTADLGHYLPIWYFDVTATVNQQASVTTNNAVATFAAAPVAYRPFIRTTPIPQLTFNKNITQFKAADGTATGGNGYAVVQGSLISSSLGNGGIRAALHNWFSAKMLCYGIANIPVRYRVSLMRFHKEHVTPGWWDATPGGTFANVTGNETTEWAMQEAVNLQQYLAGPFRYSPLNEANANMKKLFTERVLKDFVLGGATSGTPYMHQLNIFEQFNQIRRYDWEQAVVDATDTSYNQETYTINCARTQNNVKFTSRWYLCIRAQAIDGTSVDPAAPAPDTTKWPSFDILLKNKYTVLE